MARSRRGNRDQWLPADRGKSLALIKIRRKVTIMTGFSRDNLSQKDLILIVFQIMLQVKTEVWDEHVLNLRRCIAL